MDSATAFKCDSEGFESSQARCFFENASWSSNRGVELAGIPYVGVVEVASYPHSTSDSEKTNIFMNHKPQH